MAFTSALRARPKRSCAFSKRALAAASIALLSHLKLLIQSERFDDAQIDFCSFPRCFEEQQHETTGSPA